MPLHWFQIADDAAVISCQKQENQILLYRFSTWCRWTAMKIGVDNCVTFCTNNSSTKSIQYQPKLVIEGVLAPAVKNGESFCYLGLHFYFDVSNNMYKSDSLTATLSEIDLLPLHPKNNFCFIKNTYCPNSPGILRWIHICCGILRLGMMRCGTM